MEAGVSLITATKTGIARSFVILEPRCCGEHRPQSRVQPQQKQWKLDSEVSEGYRTKSRNIPSEPTTHLPEGPPRQHSMGVEQRKKIAQLIRGSFAPRKSKVLRRRSNNPTHARRPPEPSQHQASRTSTLQQHKVPRDQHHRDVHRRIS